jgi:hypothetical protein
MIALAGVVGVRKLARSRRGTLRKLGTCTLIGACRWQSCASLLNITFRSRMDLHTPLLIRPGRESMNACSGLQTYLWLFRNMVATAEAMLKWLHRKSDVNMSWTTTRSMLPQVGAYDGKRHGAQGDKDIDLSYLASYMAVITNYRYFYNA